MEKIVKLSDTIHLEVDIRGESSNNIFIIPGIGHSFKSYAELSEKLSEKFRVITVNTRGIGNSSKTTQNITMKDLALDLFKLSEYLNLANIHLLSHSFGGMIAQEFYNLHPEKIKSLILVSTHAGMQSKYSTLATKKDLAIFREKLNLADPNYSEKALEKVNILFTKEFLLQKRATPLLKKEGEYYHQCVKDEIEIENRRSAGLEYTNKNIKNIHIPTLILQGDWDRLVPKENAQILNNLIEKSKLVLFQNCGHFPFLEMPNQFLDEILLFLNSVQ